MDGKSHVGIPAAENWVNVGKHQGALFRRVGDGDLPRIFIRNVLDDLVGFLFHIDHPVGGGQIDFPGKGGDHGVLSALKKGNAQLFLQTEKLLI